MTTKVQRGMLWGALFLFACLGGGFLGRFVVAGLSGGGTMLAGDNAAANFWTQQDRARNASAMAPTNVPVEPGNAGAHVCEGCDASALHPRQLDNQSFHYDPQAADAAAGAAPAPPLPPALAPHP